MAGHVVYWWLKQRGYEVISHVYRNKLIEDSEVADLYDNLKTINKLAKKADVVVNCVGLLPANCSCWPHKAAYLNSFLPHYLTTKVKTIHISTDCVFSGSRGSYTESDPKDAQSLYGLTKSAGELIQDNVHLTIRTSIVGPEIKADGSGLFAWYQRQQGHIEGWVNAFWNGVTTFELAKFVEHALENKLSGLCHLTSGAPISKFSLLKLFRQITPGNFVSITPRVLNEAVDKSLVITRDVGWRYTRIEDQLYELKDWYGALDMS